MPFDTMLVSAAVISMFVAFAGVLMWGDFQTRPGRQRAVAPSQGHHDDRTAFGK
jgi:hypothetical protein